MSGASASALHRWFLRLAVGLLFTTTAWLWLAPARANCHVATWDVDRERIEENKGQVVLPMELDGTGPVTCTGSIKWSTRDQSAKAPGDYTAASGEVKWQPGSPRRQNVTIRIVDDKLEEGGGETFNVTMTGSTGGISPEEAGATEGGPTVRVFIADDEEAPSTPPAPTTVPPTTPAAVTTPPAAQPTETESSGSAGLIVGLVLGTLVLGGLAALLMRRRGA